MGVARLHKVALPYNGVELSELSYEQTTDTLYLAHIDHAPSKITRADHTDWTFGSLTFGPDIAAPTSVSATATVANTDSANSGDNYFPQPASYVVTAVNDDTGQESRASSENSATNDLTLKRNKNTITWTAVTGATRYNVYKADNNQFFGYIGTTEDTTFVDDNIGPALDKAPPEAENPFSGAGDYPSTVALFEQRLLWARTRNAPNAIWGSRTGVNELENMDRSRPARADDALSFAIVSSQVNPVNQLVSSTSLLALTSHGIFTVDGDGSGGTLAGNSPPAARREIGRGASRIRPILVDNVTFYVPSVGFAVRAVGYNFEIDGNRSNDVSIFSPHFFEGRSVVDWAYSQEPRSIIWAVLDDGKFAAFTWEQEQNVWGWTMCETDGQVKSVCTISENGEDRLYMIVEREVDGVTKRYVERMAAHIWTDVADTCFMDCAISGEFDPPQGTFTGLRHLEGRTDVVANADGAFYSGLSVTNGSLTLPNGITASKISIGIPYQVDVKTLPVRVNMPGTGSNIGRYQQPDQIVLHLEKTSDILAGIVTSDDSALYPVRQTQSLYGQPHDLLNGVTAEITMQNKATKEIEVHIRQTLPAPFTLLAIGVDPHIDG